ncbi:MAG: NeuD/PglB/VioB family sugar acetyltransferase [Ferruginibacter sp.]
MDKGLFEILIPKETVSDDSYKISSLLFQNGDKVKKGETLGSFETSKADMDIESPADGIIFYTDVKPGSIINVGEIFAMVNVVNEYPQTLQAEIDRKNTIQAQAQLANATGIEGLRISKSAKELIETHNIDLALFKGKKLVTKEDAELALNKSGARVKNISRPKIIIIGAGGHAKICIDIIRQNGLYEIAGTTANSEAGESVMGVPVLGTDDEVLSKIFKEGVVHAVIGVGALKNPAVRQRIFKNLKNIGFIIPTIIHPKAICEPSAIFGEGCQVMAGAIVGSDVVVSNNCVINAGTVISHDCYLEENVHITPGAILAGDVYVGENAIVGMGAAVYIGVTIGNNAVVMNNANVIKDIPENAIVSGNPASQL